MSELAEMMSAHTEIQTIAIVGDYLPRKCGIATFTGDLYRALNTQYPEIQPLVVAVNDTEEGYAYSSEVRFEIREQDLASYRRTADFLNISNVDIVCIQHEFGIYGGSSGSHLLNLLRELRMPVVTTLHTLLRNPNPEQLRVMRELSQLSSRLVVMAERGREFLRDIYQVPEEKIDVIPHGIPDMPFVDPNFFKDQFGVEGKQVLLTFGLLSPNKGIESVLHAMPAILKEFPETVYLVLGATHPNLVRDQGEVYRLGLERLARDLGIDGNVIFYNRFVELEELKEFLGAADVYITPYLNAEQITSGTLAYSFGCGKAVVSTPYWHAEELLADGRGVLVPFSDSEALAREVTRLLRDEPYRHAIRKAAYKQGREMIWSNTAQLYHQSFKKARAGRVSEGKISFAKRTLDKQAERLPEIKLEHLERMTDSTGIFQHAKFTVPDFSHGYCTDDNARALILTVLLEELGMESQRLRQLATSYLAFLHYAFNPETCLFRNFMSFDRKWLEPAGSEDSHGRSLWALGACIGRSQRNSFRTLAGQLFEQALAPVMEFQSPRSWAFALIGIHEYFRKLSGDSRANQMRDTLTQKLVTLFDNVSDYQWHWFEDIVAYDNAKLAHALLLSGHWSGNTKAREIGLRTLEWLSEIQTTEQKIFRPIGSNGFYRRNGKIAQFDQQPLEAHAMISACIEAYRQTNDVVWFKRAERAFEWFLGRNDLGLPIYDAQSGGCRDALHMDRVNQNQGAESTLAFLLSLVEMQLLQNKLRSFATASEPSKPAERQIAHASAAS